MEEPRGDQFFPIGKVASRKISIAKENQRFGFWSWLCLMSSVTEGKIAVPRTLCFLFSERATNPNLSYLHWMTWSE